MKVRILFLLLTLLVTTMSCVTNKKYVYLQHDDVNKKELPIDTLLRTYTPINFEYKIQPQDLLSVDFESLTPKEYDFLKSKETSPANLGGVGNALLIGDLVDENGEIPLAFIGKVKVSGLTVFEIQEKIQGIADEYLESPVVKVRLLNFRFTILGEVNREGTVIIANNKVTVIEALGLAGGLTDLADKSIIKIIRTEGAKTSVGYVDLLNESFIESPYYFVNQNDIIVVAALRQRPYRKYFGQNLSLIISSLSLLLLTISLINSAN